MKGSGPRTVRTAGSQVSRLTRVGALDQWRSGLSSSRHTLYDWPMATKDVIIPVRVTRADRDLLKRMAPGGSVSAWLRELALAAARRRRAVVDLARLLDASKANGDMTDEEAAELAAEAKREVRSRRR